MGLECHIIANPEGNAWELAEAIQKDLGKRSDLYTLNEFRVKKFRDGEIKVKIKENIRRKNCFFIHDSSLPPAEWLMQLAFANEAMKNSSASEVIDVLPYLKFSRQDRKDESRVAINARAVADIIGLYADRVLTIDAHFSQIQGFYPIPLDNLYSSKVLLQHLEANHPEILEEIVVMSPDSGGTSRARAFASKLGIDNIIIGYKHRPKDEEIEEYKIIGDVSGKKVLIIDDIVDSGNTLVKASKTAREQGAKKVYAYCTHGLFSDGARDKVSSELDLMITSSSVKQPSYEKIEVIQLKELFAEVLYRTNEGHSLSEIFD